VSLYLTPKIFIKKERPNPLLKLMRIEKARILQIRIWTQGRVPKFKFQLCHLLAI
jgi:hypothetical protein